MILESGRGRDLSDILEDAYVANRGDRTMIQALIDRPDVIEALGNDAIEGLRTRIAAIR